jgi:para-nitrobenzyl esterase
VRTRSFQRSNGNYISWDNRRNAAAPVGPLRWNSPRPITWRGIRNARHFGDSCLQREASGGYKAWTPENMNQTKMSEDCLNLNIWAQNKGRAVRQPVLVWIHGGGAVSPTATRLRFAQIWMRVPKFNP